MKFSPCTDQCTKDDDVCQGCGRTISEIKDSKELVAKIVAHLIKYEYEDPENFLTMLNKKSLKRLAKLQNKKA